MLRFLLSSQISDPPCSLLTLTKKTESAFLPPNLWPSFFPSPFFAEPIAMEKVRHSSCWDPVLSVLGSSSLFLPWGLFFKSISTPPVSSGPFYELLPISVQTYWGLIPKLKKFLLTYIPTSPSSNYWHSLMFVSALPLLTPSQILLPPTQLSTRPPVTILCLQNQ